MGLSELGLRLPEVEWSVRCGTGELDDGLDWVDTRLDPELPHLRMKGDDGEIRFRHFPYLSLLPTYIADEAHAAQLRGRPTAWEGLALLFARAGWTVASRSLLWAPYSPYPGVLSRLVEAFGIERSMHRFDRSRLSRLSAMLPTWYPSRGRLDSAREVLGACDLLEQTNPIWGQDEQPPAGALQDEVFCCRGARWWKARQPAGASPSLRIGSGFLRFHPREGDNWGLRREDFLVAIGDEGLSLEMFRLLPAWASVRFTTTTGDEPEAWQPPASSGEPRTVYREGDDGFLELVEEQPPAAVLEMGDDATAEALVPADEQEADEVLVLDSGGELMELVDEDLEPLDDETIVPEDEVETPVPAPAREQTDTTNDSGSKE